GQEIIWRRRAPLERSAAANAVIGMAHDPGRTLPHARNDSLRHLVAMGDEGGACRTYRLSAARGSDLGVTCRKQRPRERHGRAGQSDHLAPLQTFEFKRIPPLPKASGTAASPF